MMSSTDTKVDNNLRCTSVFVTWKIVNSFVLLPYEVFAAQLCVNLRGNEVVASLQSTQASQLIR